MLTLIDVSEAQYIYMYDIMSALFFLPPKFKHITPFIRSITRIYEYFVVHLLLSCFSAVKTLHSWQKHFEHVRNILIRCSETLKHIIGWLHLVNMWTVNVLFVRKADCSFPRIVANPTYESKIVSIWEVRTKLQLLLQIPNNLRFFLSLHQKVEFCFWFLSAKLHVFCRFNGSNLLNHY